MTAPPFLPFNRACLVGHELAYVAESIKNGHIAGDGGFTKRASALLELTLGAPKVMLTTSCTHALEMSALLLDLQPGDEVIVPSFTFVSTINAFVLRRARPVFVDVRPDTLNLDEGLVEAAISDRTRAIVPVHYAGVGCEMDALLAIANRHGVHIVEDNAHGLFGRYRGRNLGTFGAMATQSFHETKNFTCGEGGALVLNDASLVDRAEIIREKGTNRSRMFRGLVDKYTWVDVGSSYLPSDMLAAFLLAQLERAAHIQRGRQRVWDTYAAGLASWARDQGVRLPSVPAHCDQSFHMFHLRLPSLDARTRLIAHLKAEAIHSVFHYLPLHLSPMGLTFGGREGACPVTEATSDRLLRLPFYLDLTADDLARIVHAVTRFEV